MAWVSAFPELNVRTYVSVGGRPGVYFFSLDAGNPLAVGAARVLFNLPVHQHRCMSRNRTAGPCMTIGEPAMRRRQNGRHAIGQWEPLTPERGSLE